MKLLLVALLNSFVCYADELTLVGKGLLEYSVFKVDIYEISYYRGKDSLEALKLNYKTDVKKKYSIMGWEKGLATTLNRDPSLKSKLEWILENTIDFSKGDEFMIRKKKSEVSLLKNGKQFAVTNDEQIAQIIFHPWIGDDPVDAQLKQQLLKNQEKLP